MKPININIFDLASLKYEALATYLESSGWQQVSSLNKYVARYTQRFSEEGDVITILLPRDFGLPDAPQRLVEAIHQLSVIEESSPEAILEKLLSLNPRVVTIENEAMIGGLAWLPNKSSQIKYQGFYDGAQGISAELVCAGLRAQSESAQELARMKATQRVDSLTATADAFTFQLEEATLRWQSLSAQTEGVPPEVAFPALATLLALLAAVGEAVFLAPVLDEFMGNDPTRQLVLAGIIVITTSGLMKTALGAFQTDGHEASSADSGRLRFWVASLLTLFATLLTGVLGYGRAMALSFSARQNGGTIGAFLAQTQTLTIMIVTLLTLCLPVFVALWFPWGLMGCRKALHWQRARFQFNRMKRKAEKARKVAESAQANLQAEVQQVIGEYEQLTKLYLQSHALGVRIGAHRTPLWWVFVKSVSVTACVFGAFMVGDAWLASYAPNEVMRWRAELATTLGLGGVYMAWALKAWTRPSPRQLYAQRATVWSHDNPINLLPSTGAGTTEHKRAAFGEK